MNSDIAIRVENLGKMYRIGREQKRAASLPGRIGQTLASPFDWLVRQARGPSEDEILWALKDVSFEVKKGEVIGIIGRNGAGKSTLLKILSRITEPSEGRADIHGRIASLLEVGTGMHPELTGRENIYLNGCILGMKKWEIDNKFDEIVEFSGISKFIDTPVKRYSSGMRVRLGFAIAAHLEPEILLVDEVLAVGDAEFQKRCLGKMEDVAGHGRTVLFVSHNMATINTLCPQSLLLGNGRLLVQADTSSVILKYVNRLFGNAPDGDVREERNRTCRFISCSVFNKFGQKVHEIPYTESFQICLHYKIMDDTQQLLVPNLHLLDENGSYVFTVNAPNMQITPPGLYAAVCKIPDHFLNEGVYSVGWAVTSYSNDSFQVTFHERDTLSFIIKDPKIPDCENYGYVGHIPGVVHPKLEWNVRKLEEK